MPIMENPDDALMRLLDSAGAETITSSDAAIETGRRIITFPPEMMEAGLAGIREVAPGNVAMSSDFDGQDVDVAGAAGAGALVFEQLGVAVVDEATSAGVAEFSIRNEGFSAAANPFAINEPEIFMFPSGIDTAEYLRGFAAAAARIRDDLAGEGPGAPDGSSDDPAAAVAGLTWGVSATRAATSRYSGRGIKIAILDTGFDFRHPDFFGRSVVHSSFIAGESTQDGNSHGTHCTGTAAGPRAPAGAIPRYGVAFDASIFIGKVLSNAGSGSSASVLAGMNWAVANRCQVISMSLGGGGGPYAYYTQAGQQALNAGCLIIAAAGNASNRPGSIAPVGSPANSPTIMGVAALDPNLGVAYYSCGGPQVAIAGPGSSVHSTVPMPTRYGVKSGTSMATPHVAGCAALLAQSNAALRGTALRNALRGIAKLLPRPASDVGAGLVQAIQ